MQSFLTAIADAAANKRLLGLKEDWTFGSVRTNVFSRLAFRITGGTTDAAKVVTAINALPVSTLSGSFTSDTAVTRLLQKIYDVAGVPQETDAFLGGTYPNADWMSRLGDGSGFGNTVLPSGHDSGASVFDFTKTLATSGIGTLAQMPVLPRIWPLETFLKKASRTTYQTIRQQLMMGIRVLDFRVSYYPLDQQYYLSHTYCCQPLLGAIAQVREFLLAYPSEVVVLRVKPDYDNSYFASANNFGVGKLLVDGLSGLLLPCDGKSSTFSEMREASQRAVVFYLNYPSGDPNGSDAYLWPASMLDSPWFNDSNPILTTTKIIALLTKKTPWTEASFVLTPQVRDVVQSVLLIGTRWTRNPNDLAKLEAKQLQDAMTADRALLSEAGFITMDFASESGLMDAVLELNDLDMVEVSVTK